MIHNQLEHAAELQNGIASAVGLSRDLDGVLRLGETLTACIDPWTLPEWAFLRGERLGASKLFAAAVAAEFGIVGIGNPAGSGNIVVVDAFLSLANATTQLEVVAHSVIVGTVTTTPAMVSGRDRRWGSTTGRTFQVSGTDPGSTFGVPLAQQVGTLTQFQSFTEAALPLVLKPGDDLIVIAQTVNLALQANVKWRERKAFVGELSA